MKSDSDREAGSSEFHDLLSIEIILRNHLTKSSCKVIFQNHFRREFSLKIREDVNDRSVGATEALLEIAARLLKSLTFVRI